MLYMVVEQFAPDRLADIYKRLAQEGRILPEGLTYVSSWISEDLTHCYQVMETEDPGLLDEWLRNWEGYMTAEIHPVITSAEASRRVLRSP